MITPFDGSIAPVRSAALAPRVPGVSASLVYYPPGFRQQAHDHVQPHVTVVLTGGFEERLGRTGAEGRAGDLLLREAGHSHSVTFGQHGALTLALRPLAPGSDAAAGAPARARLRPLGPETAPVWLTEARQLLLQSPAQVSCAGLARRFGVHPVHLSRAFQAHFGVRPSVVRREAMVAYALALALDENEPLASCAHAAGFADQAHLTRAVKAVCGLPPARLRILLG